MAEQPKKLDVWIIDTNTVYRGVPYTVVSDWLQQGRLLGDDQVRTAGTETWSRLADLPAFAAYVPKVEPFRAEDRAEALAPVQMDFTWKRRAADEEEDVDMVPLIDVSLVLLIFFMMTGVVASTTSRINTPEASQGFNLVGDQRMYWFGIEHGADGQSLLYSLGQGSDNKALEDSDRLGFQEILNRFDQHRQQGGGRVDVRIKGDKNIPLGEVNRLMVELEKRRDRGSGQGIGNLFSEVSEKERP